MYTCMLLLSSSLAISHRCVIVLMLPSLASCLFLSFLLLLLLLLLVVVQFVAGSIAFCMPWL